MNDNALVTKESRRARIGAQEVIGVVSQERVLHNHAILSGQIANLAAREVGGVARVVLAAVGGVEVADGGAAVAVGGHGELVDVVEEGPEGGGVGEAAEVDDDVDAGRVGLGGDGDGAGDGGAGAVVDWRDVRKRNKW